MYIPGGSESVWVLHGFSLCLRMYGGKIKSHRLLYDFHILNIWISKKNMPPPNPKPSASFLIHHLARRDEFSWSPIPPRSCRILDEILMSVTIYQLAFQHMTVLLPNVLPFGFLQSKLITVRLLQISVSSCHVHLNRRSRSKKQGLKWKKVSAPKEPTIFLILCLGGILPGLKIPRSHQSWQWHWSSIQKQLSKANLFPNAEALLIYKLHW